MYLGLKKQDEDVQQQRKENYQFTEKIKKTKWYLLLFMAAIWLLATIIVGIQSLFDKSKFSIFIIMLMFLVLVVGACWGMSHLLDWFWMWMNKRMYIRDIPHESKRTLRKILNSMRPNAALIVWNALWICIVFTAILVGLELLFKNPLSFFQIALKYVAKAGPIALIGFFFLRWLHDRKNYVEKMLKWTKKYYNYGDEKQGVLFKEYVEWSLKNSMLLNCQSLVITNEFLLGSADSNMLFYPVAIPRDFIREAEVRMVYSHARTKNAIVNICDAVLACRLNNDKVVDFYLARNQGVEMVLERLQASGFDFTVRTDVVEYQ